MRPARARHEVNEISTVWLLHHAFGEPLSIQVLEESSWVSAANRLVHFGTKFNARGAKEVRRKLGYTQSWCQPPRLPAGSSGGIEPLGLPFRIRLLESEAGSTANVDRRAPGSVPGPRLLRAAVGGPTARDSAPRWPRC